MRFTIPNRVVVRALVALEVFLALSALVGAIPRQQPFFFISRFSSFAIPGLLLGVAIGGTQAAAAAALLTRNRSGLLLPAVAGFGILVWIFTELAIIQQYSWLQAVYFVHGGMELLLVLALLGIAPAIVAPMHNSNDSLRQR